MTGQVVSSASAGRKEAKNDLTRSWRRSAGPQQADDRLRIKQDTSHPDVASVIPPTPVAPGSDAQVSRAAVFGHAGPPPDVLRDIFAGVCADADATLVEMDGACRASWSIHVEQAVEVML